MAIPIAPMAHATEMPALAPVLREVEPGRAVGEDDAVVREAGLMVLYMVVTRPEIVARVLETEASDDELVVELEDWKVAEGDDVVVPTEGKVEDFEEDGDNVLVDEGKFEGDEVVAAVFPPCRTAVGVEVPKIYPLTLAPVIVAPTEVMVEGVHEIHFPPETTRLSGAMDPAVRVEIHS
jgi:hypothetical protein